MNGNSLIPPFTANEIHDGLIIEDNADFGAVADYLARTRDETERIASRTPEQVRALGECQHFVGSYIHCPVLGVLSAAGNAPKAG